MNTFNGIISKPSKYSVDETINRLETVLESKDIAIFARIDQAREAEKVGLTLQPIQLLIFGKPESGTSLMAFVPISGIDLPFKALAWQDNEGKVWLSYNAPDYLQQRFSFPDELIKNVTVIESLITQALA